jgi:hypothetical protein
MAEVDDWIVDDGKPQDWVTPPQNLHDKIGARDPLNVAPGTPGARVLEAAGRGAKEGFGDEPLGIVGGSKTDKELAKLGIFHDGDKGYVGPIGAVQLLNEAILRPTAASVDAFFRALSGGVYGVAAGAGQVAQELGQSPEQAAKLSRDVLTGEDLALMSHVPERQLLQAGRSAGSPAYAPVQSSPSEVEAFLGRARGMQARKEVDDFLREQEARRAAQPAPAGTPQLPPPSEGAPSAPAAAQPPNAPAPEAPAAPVAGARPIDESFPNLDEPTRASPAPVDDWIIPQETPNDRQVGPGLPGQVGARQEPQPAGPVESAGGAPAQAGGILQAPQGAPAAENVARPNVAPPSLQELFADPRTADQMRADRAAERGRIEAVGQRGALDAGQNVTTTPDVIALGPPAPAPATTTQTVVNDQPPAARPTSLQELFADPRSADEIRAEIEAAKRWQPTADWQEVPQIPGGYHNPVMSGLETRTEDGKTFARIPPPPPTPGTPEAPVELTGPADVHHGAAITAEPTPAQAEAGNYRKRHVTWNGLDIAIETEAGQERTGIGPNNAPWSVTLQHPYGYIKRTEGADGEQVDVYLGPHPQSPHVYIVDQIDPATGAFDEHKALIGFPDEVSARAAYAAGFSDNLGPARLGALRAVTVPEFKTWLHRGDLTKPTAYSDPVEAARALAKEHGLNATDAEIEAAARSAKDNNADLLDELVSTIEHAAIVEEADSPDSIQRQEAAHAPVTADTSGIGKEPAQAGEQAGRAGAQEIEQAPAVVEPHGNERDQAAEPVKKPPTPQVPAEPGTKYVLPSFVTNQYVTKKPTRGGKEPSDWTEIGKNEIGQTLYEDQRGVRSYIENGVRTTEAVPIRPTRAGVEVEKPEHKDEWRLASETTKPATNIPENITEPALEPIEPYVGTAAPTARDLIKLANTKMNDAQRADARRYIERMMEQMEAEGRKIAEHCLETAGKFSLRG